MHWAAKKALNFIILGATSQRPNARVKSNNLTSTEIINLRVKMMWLDIQIKYTVNVKQSHVGFHFSDYFKTTGTKMADIHTVSVFLLF